MIAFPCVGQNPKACSSWRCKYILGHNVEMGYHRKADNFSYVAYYSLSAELGRYNKKHKCYYKTVPNIKINMREVIITLVWQCDKIYDWDLSCSNPQSINIQGCTGKKAKHLKCFS